MQHTIDLINIIFPDPKTALFFIVITLITLWLYKQFQTRIIESEKNRIVKTDKAIEVYTELDFEIKRFLKDKSDISIVYTKIIKASVYLPGTILNDLQEWIELFEQEADIEQLVKMQKVIREEIRRLKLTQLDPVTYKGNSGLTELIKLYYKTKLYSIVEPIFHTGVSIFILVLMLLYAFIYTNVQEFTEKVLLTSLLVAMLIFILILDILVTEVLVKGRFVHSLWNWILFGTFIIVNIILVFVGPWFRGILMIVVSIAYAFYATIFSINKFRKN